MLFTMEKCKECKKLTPEGHNPCFACRLGVGAIIE